MSGTALPAGRIVGLDAWRAGLMCAGLFVHASIRLHPTMLADTIAALSQAFRMGTFFAISGFLAAIVLPRRDPVRWLRGRVVRLGIPALFGMTVLAPAIWWLTVVAPPTPGRPLLPFEWHHLWFLFALLGYSVVLAAVEAADRQWSLLSRLDGAVRGPAAGRLALLLVAVSGALLFALAAPAMRATMPPAYILPFANLQSIAGYLPSFLFGVVLARCPALRACVFAQRWWATLVVAIGAAAIVATCAGFVPPAAGDYVRFVTATLCPPAAIALILHAALATRAIPPLAQRIADASYTIYLLHVPVAVIVNVTIGRLLEPNSAYLVCVTVAGTSAYAAHRLALRHAPALLVLLNGDLSQRWRAAAADQWTKRATTSR